MTEDDVRAEIATAYEAVVRAKAAGGNVDGLVPQLDSVARKLPGASFDSLVMYKSIVDFVLADATGAETHGIQRVTNRFVIVGFCLVLIAAFGMLVWVCGSRWFWRVWLRAHRGWRVERT